LVATGRSALTEAPPVDFAKSWLRRGRKPTRIEVIRGELVLRGLVHATQITVESLDGAGNPQTTQVISVEAGTAKIVLGNDVTVWYLLTVMNCPSPGNRQ
jgi:hypothetical protein